MTLNRNSKATLKSDTASSKKLARYDRRTKNPAIIGILVYLPNTKIRKGTDISLVLGASLPQKIDLALMTQETSRHDEQMVGTMLTAI